MEGRKMSHGFIDDIPGHAEFWRRFHSGQSRHEWWARMKVRYGLLRRLLKWKLTIYKLGRVYPDYTLRKLEELLIEIEVKNILLNVLRKEEK